MARTFRHTNKDSKIPRGYIVAYEFDFDWNNKGRKTNKIKGGSIIEGNERCYQKIVSGCYQKGVPKAYRKRFNKRQKNKMKKDLFRKVRENRVDEIESGKYIRNAGYYYY